MAHADSAVNYIKSDGDFDKAIEDANTNSQYVIVDFYADWCGPCKMIAPYFEQLAGENKGIVFLKVDIDSCTETSNTYGVQSIPTFTLFKDKKQVSSFSGANKNNLANLVAKTKQ